MTRCEVAYRDVEGIEHRVEVEADSLYEAIAAAVSSFRKGLWGGCPPGPGCMFNVKVFPDRPQVYSVALSQVESFARHGTAKGPKDILRKQRIQDMLGLKL